MPDIPDMFPVSRKRLKSAYGTVITVFTMCRLFVGSHLCRIMF